jgi:hypothetical protein
LSESSLTIDAAARRRIDAQAVTAAHPCFRQTGIEPSGVENEGDSAKRRGDREIKNILGCRAAPREFGRCASRVGMGLVQDGSVPFDENDVGMRVGDTRPRSVIAPGLPYFGVKDLRNGSDFHLHALFGKHSLACGHGLGREFAQDHEAATLLSFSLGGEGAAGR